MRHAPMLFALAAVSTALGVAASASAQCACQASPPPAAMLNPPPINPYSACEWKDDFVGKCTHRELLYQSPRAPWCVQTDALALRRDPGEDVTFASLGAQPVLSTHDLEFEFQGGLRALVGHQFGERFAIEGSYFGLMEWDEPAAVRSAAPLLNSPFTDNNGLLGIDGNTFISIRTESSLDNIEINIRQWLYTPPSMMRASALYGVRYMNINENFAYRSETPAPAAALSAVDVRTENHLIGFQFGGSMEFYIEPRGWITFEGKAAVCNNAGEQSSSGAVGVGGAAVDNFAESNRTGFIGDIALTLMYAFTPNTVGRIGYQAMWVEGLALGSENFERDLQSLTLGPGALVHDGNLVYHGPFVGLMTTW